MNHEHEWFFNWENEDGCRCGSCVDFTKPYLTCDCGTELRPSDQDFDLIWRRVSFGA